MWIGKDYVFGGSGGLRYSFEPVGGYHSGLIDLYKDRGFGAKYMAALCNNWRSIKGEITHRIADQICELQSSLAEGEVLDRRK